MNYNLSCSSYYRLGKIMNCILELVSKGKLNNYVFIEICSVLCIKSICGV